MSSFFSSVLLLMFVGVLTEAAKKALPMEFIVLVISRLRGFVCKLKAIFLRAVGQCQAGIEIAGSSYACPPNTEGL